MIRRSFLAGLLSLVLFALPAAAATPEEGARQFVKGLADRAIDALKNDLPKTERDKRFQELLGEGFDVPAIARFCLGGFWDKATEAERQEYTKLFQDLIVQTYSARLGSIYNGQKLDVGAARADGKVGMWVTTRIVSPNAGDDPVRVDWRVRQPSGTTYKVVDVVVNNISMVVTQRDDFVGVLQRNGGNMKDFMGMLRDKITKLQTGGA
jgi:phospholipid transport system substrate-binding protein